MSDSSSLSFSSFDCLGSMLLLLLLLHHHHLLLLLLLLLIIIIIIIISFSSFFSSSSSETFLFFFSLFLSIFLPALLLIVFLSFFVLFFLFSFLLPVAVSLLSFCCGDCLPCFFEFLFVSSLLVVLFSEPSSLSPSFLFFALSLVSTTLFSFFFHRLSSFLPLLLPCHLAPSYSFPSFASSCLAYSSLILITTSFPSFASSSPHLCSYFLLQQLLIF